MNGFEGLTVSLTLPDMWQQEAVRELKSGKDVIVDAPTGAGKTYVFELVREVIARRGQSIYTVPTRALANDKLAEWRAKGWDVGIATGDLAENVGAPVVVATLETQLEGLLRGSGPALLVIDEYQMIGDSMRGVNYELVVALAPPETQLLMLSGSVGNAGAIRDWLERLNRKAVLVQTKERPVPLDEIPVEALPRPAPTSVKGFWPRVAAEVLMADLGPLLIFAPRRAGAEKIARQIAKGLPCANPLQLSQHQMSACGRELAGMLEKRVAYHHSGLPYAGRAGVVEPLAKSGHLRVVVATMGLAAGINFSMRSVLVSDTTYNEGPFQREVSPDELLQMFGRAGRRGIDEMGYVLVADRSPRLMDAAPVQLRRVNEVGWPALLRVMARAAEKGASPFEAAIEACRNLFSRNAVVLGVEGWGESAHDSNSEDSTREISNDDGRALFGLEASRSEVRNADGEWETFEKSRAEKVPLGRALVWNGKSAIPALSNAKLVEGLAEGVGRLCKLPQKPPTDHVIYGREIAMATVREEDGEQRTKLTRSGMKLAGARRRDVRTMEELEKKWVPRLCRHLDGGDIVGTMRRKDTIYVQIGFSERLETGYRDRGERMLVNPERREIAVGSRTDLFDPVTGTKQSAPQNSAAYAWRKLGLIAKDGTPERRGVIFSYFQRGEGLAVAAALEDTGYPIDELVFHLANLRGGHRFSEADGSGSERLAIACRSAFGVVDYEGYLLHGLPVGYGEGTAEVVANRLEGRGINMAVAGVEDDLLGTGDIERAFVEWLSLLRHIRGAPDYPWDRWDELKAAAKEALNEHGEKSPTVKLPEIPASQLKPPPRHALYFRR